MTGPAAEVAAAHERRRRRPLRRILLVGGATSVVGAGVVGSLGADGGGSLAAAFIGVSLTTGLAGLVTLGGAVRDELRSDPVPRGRIVVGCLLLLAAPLALVLAAGAASAA